MKSRIFETRNIETRDTEHKKGILTYAYSDQRAEVFKRALMKIKDGRRTDTPIIRELTERDMVEKIYYIKPDPDFESGAYSICHPEIRLAINENEYLFFRTLWRKQPYLLGYFKIGKKVNIMRRNAPILVASEKECWDFDVPITPEIVSVLNPRRRQREGEKFNDFVNYALGYRGFLPLIEEQIEFLLSLRNCG